LNSKPPAIYPPFVSATSKEILERSKVIAVVGASRDVDKPSGSVPQLMQKHGWRIIPVNPFADELFGERCYKSLLDIPEKVDLVDVFRPSADTPPIARDAVAIRAGALWLQSGIANVEARRIAEEAGIDYVEDECVAVVRSIHRLRAPR
jgi:predicted CoA-binding protein